MSLTVVANLFAVAGDDLTYEFPVTDEIGIAANLTGATPKFVMARTLVSTPVISTEESPATATATVTIPPGSLFTLEIDGAATVGLRGVYRWQAKVQDASGDETTVIEGRFTFSASMIP